MSLMVLSAYLCHSQTKTTWEDYRYITKGLLEDENNGRLLKEGYTKGNQISKKDAFSNGIRRTVTVYQFINPQHKPIAYILYCTDNQSQRYLCLPASSSDKDIFQQCYNDIMRSGIEWGEVLTWVLMDLVGRRL